MKFSDLLKIASSCIDNIDFGVEAQEQYELDILDKKDYDFIYDRISTHLEDYNLSKDMIKNLSLAYIAKN